ETASRSFSSNGAVPGQSPAGGCWTGRNGTDSRGRSSPSRSWPRWLAEGSELKKSHVENTVGPWARKKLDSLERYLEAYHRVMQRQPFKLIYIDAFAGAGRSRVRSQNNDDPSLDLPIDDEQAAAEEEFIAGSPVRALETGRGFDYYFFFDADERRTAQLEQLKREYPGRKIQIKTGDANEGVQKLAAHFHQRPYARGVAFLDPYGPHLHWRTV